jgi:hypothetical protein
MGTATHSRAPAGPMRQHAHTRGTTDTMYNQVWEILQNTAKQAQENSVQLGMLAEAVKDHHDRIVVLEKQPRTQASSIRGWISILVAGAGGCLIPLVIFVGGVIMTMVGWLGYLLISGAHP